jgi:hypothetical protein
VVVEAWFQRVGGVCHLGGDKMFGYWRDGYGEICIAMDVLGWALQMCRVLSFGGWFAEKCFSERLKQLALVF